MKSNAFVEQVSPPHHYIGFKHVITSLLERVRGREFNNVYATPDVIKSSMLKWQKLFQDGGLDKTSISPSQDDE